MASFVEDRLQDAGYRRFVLACLSLDWACIQLGPYLLHEVEGLHRDLLANGHTRPLCHNNSNTYKEVKRCPQLSCGSSVRFLNMYHSNRSIQAGWKNSQIDLWERQPWALALVFMNPGQDPATNISPADTDISGILNLIMYCTRFGADRTIVENIRKKRNKLIHHSPTFEVKQADFDSLLDDIYNLLHDLALARHVAAADVNDYVDKVKNMKLDITFNDEIKLFEQMLLETKDENHDKVKGFIDNLKEVQINIDQLHITSNQQSEAIGEIRTVLDQHETAINQHKGVISQMIMSIVNNIWIWIKWIFGRYEDPVQLLRQELVNCYSRPEFTRLSPLLDVDTVDLLIESVYVEVSLIEKTIKPTYGKSGLEDSIRQHGTPVQNVNDVIPPPSGKRILLTGFVGSGKSSLCLFWINQWVCGHSKSHVYREMNNYELVVFLRARALENSISQSVAHMLYGEQDDVDSIKIRNIKDALSKPSTLIILDGYDEASTKPRDIADQLISCKTLAKASVIITSRQKPDDCTPDKWYENLGFNREQQLSFIRKFKCSLPEGNMEHFEKFEQCFLQDERSSLIFTYPMMAMTTCSMVASGEEVEFGSRVRNYQQVTDYLTRRAYSKYHHKLTHDEVTRALSDFTKAVYFQLLEHNKFHFTRKEILVYVSPDTLDNIIVHLGYLSVTNYIHGNKPDIAYAFVHKSWAEFTAAKYVMSLPIDVRYAAVDELFKLGPTNLEVLRFTLGLCSQDEPEHLASLFETAVKVDRKPSNDLKKLTTISEGYGVSISRGSAYILLLLTDVDTYQMSPTNLCELSQMCKDIREAKIEQEENVDVTSKERRLALSLYAGLLISTFSAQNTLSMVQELHVWCESDSPHSAISRLPTTIATCAPSMSALTCVDVRGLVSSSELGQVCHGLTASRLPCLNNLTLFGVGDLCNVAGGDLGPLVHVIRAATELQMLELSYIHTGNKEQLDAVCGALGNDAQHLTHLELACCSVSAQQYRTILLSALLSKPALHANNPFCLSQVTLGRQREEVYGAHEEWLTLERELIKVAMYVNVS